MSFLEEEILAFNAGENRMYTIHSPKLLKTQEELNCHEFLNIVVEFLNNPISTNNNKIIYSWNNVPQLRKLYKNNNGIIKSEIISHTNKIILMSKIKENETLKLCVKMWYSCKIKLIIWSIFRNYKIVRMIMTNLNLNDECNQINMYQIEEILTNIANS
jgi:hypothetical protein